MSSPQECDPPRCTCWVVDPRYWFTHYGATEPGSTAEFNPECPEHSDH